MLCIEDHCMVMSLSPIARIYESRSQGWKWGMAHSLLHLITTQNFCFSQQLWELLVWGLSPQRETDYFLPVKTMVPWKMRFGGWDCHLVILSSKYHWMNQGAKKKKKRLLSWLGDQSWLPMGNRVAATQWERGELFLEPRGFSRAPLSISMHNNKC